MPILRERLWDVRETIRNSRESDKSETEGESEERT